MATIKICDRCGSIIYSRANITYAKLYDCNKDMQSEYELCLSCAARLRELLMRPTRKDGPEETE